MTSTISRPARKELVQALRRRYALASKSEKTKILDEFVALDSCHRKHAVRLLGEAGRDPLASRPRGKRIYDEAVREVLIVAWEAADRICGKRLKAILPTLVDSMERHGHLSLDSEIRTRLLSASAATIDRLLTPMRGPARGRKRGAFRKRIRKNVPVKTYSDWDDPAPGYLEIDFVVHSGGSMAGSFVHSLVATDVCSGWTEFIPLLAREQSLVVQGFEVIRGQLPVPVLGINSDNDSAFINETLLSYCKDKRIEFTRSRARRKNDQAWIEQKNGAIIRRFVGHERFSGVVAGQALAHLYHSTRRYVNYFQPSFKLLEKKRYGSKVRKTYLKPATPCDRLLDHHDVDDVTKEMLRLERAQLDPLEPLHRIRTGQTALAALNSPETVDGPARESLDQFLSQLPRLWRSGEVRPTHRKTSLKLRTWRTRKDPFETVWSDILGWLQQNPETTAKELFERLTREYPGRFADGQLRTLQRRIRDWRHVMARKLVYACLDEEHQSPEVSAVGGTVPGSTG